MASFVVTAVVTLVASIVGHVLRPSDLAELPSLDPREEFGSLPRNAASRVDQGRSELSASLPCRNEQLEAKRRMWSNILDRLILSLSDQQLVACFAVVPKAAVHFAI